MSGPIVRSGASPEFSKNWERIFAKKSKNAGGSSATAKKASKTAKKAKPAPAPKKKAAKKKR